MLDAALDGRLEEALILLNRLMLSGESPLAVLGQVSATLRRMAAATRLVLLAESEGRRPNLRLALEEAGVRGFFLAKTEAQMRRLGRQRGTRLYDWLLEAQLDLRGQSRLPPQVILERLLVRLSAPPAEVLHGR